MAILDIKQELRNLVDRIDGDLLRNGVELLTHLVMNLEVAEQIGAERYERTDTRQDYRNGTRTRSWETRVGEIELRGAVSILEARYPKVAGLLGRAEDDGWPTPTSRRLAGGRSGRRIRLSRAQIVLIDLRPQTDDGYGIEGTAFPLRAFAAPG